MTERTDPGAQFDAEPKMTAAEMEATITAQMVSIEQSLVAGVPSERQEARVEKWFLEHSHKTPDQIPPADQAAARHLAQAMRMIGQAYTKFIPEQGRRILRAVPPYLRYAYLVTQREASAIQKGREAQELPMPKKRETLEWLSQAQGGDRFAKAVELIWTRNFGIAPGSGMGAAPSPSGKRRLVPKSPDEDAKRAVSRAIELRRQQKEQEVARQRAAARPEPASSRTPVWRLTSEGGAAPIIGSEVPQGHVRRLAPSGPSGGATEAQERRYRAMVAKEQARLAAEQRPPQIDQSPERQLGPLESDPLAGWKQHFSGLKDAGPSFFIDPEGYQTPGNLIEKARLAGYPTEQRRLLEAFVRGEAINERYITSTGGLREAARQARERATDLARRDREAAQGRAAQLPAPRPAPVASRPVSQPIPPVRPAVAAARSRETVPTKKPGRAERFFRMLEGGLNRAYNRFSVKSEREVQLSSGSVRQVERMLLSKDIEKLRKKEDVNGLRKALGDKVEQLEGFLFRERIERNSEIIATPDIPTAVIGDIHARPDAIPNALINAMKELSGNARKSDKALLKLAETKIANSELAVVLLGDYAHSEHDMGNWLDMSKSEKQKKAIVKELADYTQVISQLVMLKELATLGGCSENVVILRGNHDDIINRDIAKGVEHADGTKGVVAQAVLWSDLCVGDDNLKTKIAAFEDNLPLMAYNEKNRIVWAHDVPNINAERLQRLKEKTGYGKRTSLLINWTNFSRDLYGGERVPLGVHDGVLRILKQGLFRGTGQIQLEVGHTAGEQALQYLNGQINTRAFRRDDAGVKLHHFS